MENQNNIVNLTELKENEICEIVKIDGIMALKRRLLELGFVDNTRIKIINISPLKNSYLLEIRGYIIALRKSAVKNIYVRRI